MIEHEKEYYYSLTEIATMVNRGEPETEELKKRFCEVYRKPESFYFLDSYFQSKIYPAIKNKRIRYLTYRKENGNKYYYVFRIKDIIDYLNNPLARNIEQQKWVDIKVVEPEL